jgi:hypothetical protein
MNDNNIKLTIIHRDQVYLNNPNKNYNNITPHKMNIPVNNGKQNILNSYIQEQNVNNLNSTSVRVKPPQTLNLNFPINPGKNNCYQSPKSYLYTNQNPKINTPINAGNNQAVKVLKNYQIYGPLMTSSNEKKSNLESIQQVVEQASNIKIQKVNLLPRVALIQKAAHHLDSQTKFQIVPQQSRVRLQNLISLPIITEGVINEEKISHVVSNLNDSISSQKQLCAKEGTCNDYFPDLTSIVGIELKTETNSLLNTAKSNNFDEERVLEDKFILNKSVLSKKIRQIIQNYDIDVSDEVTTFVAHATEEYLRNIIEKLDVIARHRQDKPLKSLYDINNSVKNQLKFLAEIEKIKNKRKEDDESKKLMKEVKNRSKQHEDKLNKIKRKDKELLQAEQDEKRLQVTNRAAIEAIGSSKKRKIDTESRNLIQSSAWKPKKIRVTSKDMVFFMEREKRFCRSNILLKLLNK